MYSEMKSICETLRVKPQLRSRKPERKLRDRAVNYYQLSIYAVPYKGIKKNNCANIYSAIQYLNNLLFKICQ